jgi:predicted DNA-binding transcriptional regulator AlpA
MPPIPKDQLSPYGGCASSDVSRGSERGGAHRPAGDRGAKHADDGGSERASDDDRGEAAVLADALLDISAVCAMFGGSRPLNPATIYRGIAEGRFPRPIKIGRNSNRWLRSECAAMLAAIIAEPRLPRAYRGPRNRLRRNRHVGQDPT